MTPTAGLMPWYPEPYYGDNNRLEKYLIPDISTVGNDFYTYCFRTEFTLPETFRNKTVWLQPDGINYRAQIYVNGNLVSVMAGMFQHDNIDISSFVHIGQPNAIAILVFPVDVPGTTQPKSWGAAGEFRNGGNGDIGWNVTQLMTVGWDFTFPDGVRDRNTGIWRGISLFATGRVAMKNPFIRSAFHKGNYTEAYETISVELHNPGYNSASCEVRGEIEGSGISFSQKLRLLRGEERECVFSPERYKQLILKNPKLWWPVNKGTPNLYKLKLYVLVDGKLSDSISTRFGIREITTNRNTPDKSKLFYINGKPLFVRGSNWVPEAMLRNSDMRTEAELRYTAQIGINLLRLWGGGIAESNRFYELCDELGILVWQEFWLTGDTRHPHDRSLYLNNVEATVKRIRNHPSIAFYVSSNESTEVSGTPQLLTRIDGTRPYQMQSETDGVHDGSPYKQVNPMQHYENTASERGSRIDGFNPEYGAPALPVYESLREMMPHESLWPIDKKVWDYMDGNGFHLMTSLYHDLVNAYGIPSSLEDFCRKAQLLNAMNAKSIWECWNENKLKYGKRFTSGLLFWYHNSPNPQVAARFYDHSLVPTAMLYHTKHALEPVHVQFNYLTNTVSVVNDTESSFDNLSVEATIYNLNSKPMQHQTTLTKLASDGVANDVITLKFPSQLTPVHFIHLLLKDKDGKVLSENFYWRSTNLYKGRKTLTGPCTAGFETLQNMPQTKLSIKRKITSQNGQTRITLTLQNKSKHIAFFNNLLLTNGEGAPIRPVFYSDNFFTIMPGNKRIITIDVDTHLLSAGTTLTCGTWNGITHKFTIAQ